jgi:hypothetical protein
MSFEKTSLERQSKVEFYCEQKSEVCSPVSLIDTTFAKDPPSQAKKIKNEINIEKS